ncbi:MAG: ABC transporter ATP-binding protein [Muribaculaceae bacterium]|nr:ABC transporter ATP-binding protein [Muribaculaceae bacterium]
MKTAVEIKDLTKRYGDLTALDSISLTVNEGELFGIIGPDGAGKSTLYQILATLLNPNAGSASIFGLDTVKDYRTLRRMIGYMPEKFSLYQDLTVQENLRFFASLFGVSVKDNFNLIAPVFGQLEKFPNRKAGALSGGMKQKLALSCALIHRPSILLLDEPTTGVDAVSRSEFWDILHSLKESRMTILVSTSYMDEATLCDRIAMIDKGHILKTGRPDDLISSIGKNLWQSSAKEMFALLEEYRKMPEVIDCYTFGAYLHIVADDNFNSRIVKDKLSQTFKDFELSKATGTIEDLFIKLSRENHNVL